MTARHFVPSFISWRAQTEGPGADAFVLSNAANGAHFEVNAQLVNLLHALRDTEDLGHACRAVSLPGPVAAPLIGAMKAAGVIVERGKTAEAPKPVVPLESRAISVRLDLWDGAEAMRRLSGFGALLFSWVGLALWGVLVSTALAAVLDAPDKALVSLRAVRQAGLQEALIFAGVYIALKVFHETGHGLAYRMMCLREGLDPGPIRMGVSIFAMTPFAFTDVTGAWRIRSRRRRALIGAGGLYLELAAIAGFTLLWAWTSTGPLQTTLFQVATFSAVSSVIFNMNPLIKLDGYYVLADLTGVYNRAPRASKAAMAWVARAVGAQAPAPRAQDLAYWGGSYLYRWSIFSGIFWVAWRFDPRFAWVVGAGILMMLVIRPMSKSLSYARRQGPRPARVALIGAGLVGLAVLLALPLPDSVRARGWLSLYETGYVYAPEPGALRIDQGDVTLYSPALIHAQRDAELRAERVSQTLRAIPDTGSEQAQLRAQLDEITAIRSQLQGRADALTQPAPPGSDWTPLAARSLQGQWVSPAQSGALGARAVPSSPKLLLWLPQGQAETGLLARQSAPLQIRLKDAPRCLFSAQLAQGDSIVQKGYLRLVARPEALPPCAAKAPHGAPVVARLVAREKSIFSHGLRRIAQLLQNRLPIEDL